MRLKVRLGGHAQFQEGEAVSVPMSDATEGVLYPDIEDENHIVSVDVTERRIKNFSAWDYLYFGSISVR